MNENEFDYLSVLTDEEKRDMIRELEEDIEAVQDIIDNPNTSSEQRSELYSDIANETRQIEYLKQLLNQQQM